MATFTGITTSIRDKAPTSSVDNASLKDIACNVQSPELATITDAAAQIISEPATVELNTNSAAVSTDADAISKLAAMNSIEYDRNRKPAARALNIQVKTLDDLVKAKRDKSGSTERLPFRNVDPHTESVDPTQLLSEVAELLLKYVVMDREQADAAALWIAFTWFIDDVQVAPIAIINAPEKACGKSQLLTLFGYLTCRPLPAANSTPSFLFRAIGAWHPTILIDEADTFIRDNDELKGLVNAGHTRANAYVGRTISVGDGHEPVLFDVWSAKAFAGISLEKHLPDATMSRGIIFNLRRKMADENVERLRYADRSGFELVSAKFARLADDFSEQVRAARPVLPEELSDRTQDNWEPLFAIAECAGLSWLERAAKAAISISHSMQTSVSSGNELLADIRDVFELKKVFKISSVDLIDALTSETENAWATYNRGKPISPRQLSKLLDAYGIKSKTVRMQFGTPKGYDLAQFEDAFARYLAKPENLPQQRNAATDSNTGIDTAVATDDWVADYDAASDEHFFPSSQFAAVATKANDSDE